MKADDFAQQAPFHRLHLAEHPQGKGADPARCRQGAKCGHLNPDTCRKPAEAAPPHNVHDRQRNPPDENGVESSNSVTTPSFVISLAEKLAGSKPVRSQRRTSPAGPEQGKSKRHHPVKTGCSALVSRASSGRINMRAAEISATIATPKPIASPTRCAARAASLTSVRSISGLRVFGRNPEIQVGAPYCIKGSVSRKSGAIVSEIRRTGDL